MTIDTLSSLKYFPLTYGPAFSLSLINCKNHLEVDLLLAFEWFVYTQISRVHTEPHQCGYLLEFFHWALGFFFF